MQKPRTPDPTRRLLIAGAAVAGGALAAPALSAGARRWRMVTSWPRDLPGPGVSAARIAEAIGSLSGGKLTVEVHGAGSLAPALGVLDAVASGTAELGHTASVFHTGRAQAAALFTSAPFGLTPVEHQAWIEQRGGQELWDRLYAPWGVRPLLAGNTGASLGGWFRRPVTGLDSLTGRRMRIAGLGADLMERLGVVPVAIPPGDLFQSLASGVVDGAEFASPASDYALALHKAAAHGYGPGFHEPNGASELLVSRAAFDGLDATLQAVIRHAAAAEHGAGLAAATERNAQALAALGAENAAPEPWPRDVLEAAARAAPGVYERLAARDADSARIVTHYLDALDAYRGWTALSLEPFLAARDAFRRPE